MATMDYSKSSPFTQREGAYLALANPSKRGTVLVLGTSIAAAVGASNASKAYPARIEANLALLTGQSIWTAIAAGVSGDNTSQMLARLTALMDTNSPQYVVIEVSVNDSRVDMNITPATTLANIQSMVDIVQSYGAVPVLVGSAPFDVSWWNSASYNFTSPIKASDNNVAIKSLAATKKLLYVDLFPLLLGRVGVLYDGLHPNDSGHDIWGKAIAEAIRLSVNSKTQTTIVSDSFNRADSSTGIGAAEVGGTWVQSVANTWGIASNRAYITGTPSQYATAVLETSKTDVTVQGVIGITDRGIGFTTRWVDDNNYYVGEISNARVINIWKRVAGTFTNLYTSSALTSLVPGDTITFNTEGSHLAVFHNGKCVASVTDATHTTGTKAGLWNAGNLPAIDSVAITV